MKKTILPPPGGKKKRFPARKGEEPGYPGAENGTRTRDPQLGKLMLYQLSYFRPMSCCPARV